jgi:hypothetical protein
MDDYDNTNGAGAWFLSRLGNAIDVYVDRQLNSPQVLQNGSGYGVDQNGNLYQVGKPTTVQGVTPVGGGSMNMLLLVGLVILVATHGK